MLHCSKLKTAFSCKLAQCFSTVMDVLARVRSFCCEKDLKSLREWKSLLLEKLAHRSSLSNAELYHKFVSGDLHRNFLAESFLPKDLKEDENRVCIALRSTATGNCLFSSVSLSLVGDNSLVDDLRALTVIELFVEASFYSNHPLFSSLCSSHPSIFQSAGNILGLSVSHSSLDTSAIGSELVQMEAIHICSNNVWTSFLSILALPNVTKRPIQCYYPSCGPEKLKYVFNSTITCNFPSSSEYLHILFCCEGVTDDAVFKHNHFVPLLFCAKANVRKRKLCNLTSSSVVKPKLKLQSKLPFLKSVVKNLNENHDSSKSHPLQEKSKHTSTFPPNVVSSSASCTSSLLSTNSSRISHESSATLDMDLPLKKVNVTKCASNYCYDIANFINKGSSLKDSEIVDIVTNIFIPDEEFSFPKSISGRKFHVSWLKQFPWLCYSPSLDGAFCLSCVIFGFKFSRSSKVKKFHTEPFKYWPDATAAFTRHGEGKKGDKVKNLTLHKETYSVYLSFMKTRTGKAPSVDFLISNQLKQEVEQNRKFLVPIVDTVILLGRLGLPYRGHRDDSQHYPEVGKYSSGSIGNFVEILNYRVRGGDHELEAHLQKCSKNATYISKTSQNELIKCCGDIILEKIISEVKENKFFSILGDEASDSSNCEQLSLCLRFVDRNCDIREEFVGFLPCDQGLSGISISKTILSALGNYGLDVKNCRGQGYDGAGAVAGSNNGASAHIRNINPKALYTHCHSHRLSLSIVKSCTIQPVKNVMEQIKELTYFFKFSPSRQLLLSASIVRHNPGSHTNKLHDVCRTRWIERITGMNDFVNLFPAIVFCLEDMSMNLEGKCNRDTSIKATSYLALITSFQFISSLVISQNILDKLLPVTRLLQASTIDISESLHLINALKSDLLLTRESIDVHHIEWYNQALALAGRIGTMECKPRVSVRQVHRINLPSESPSEYYKRSISIQLIDHLISELTSRFADCKVYEGLVVIPAKMITLVNKTGLFSWKSRFMVCSEFFHEDLPSPFSLNNELDLWERYWVEFKGSHPDNISDTLKSINFPGFENIKVVLRILGTLPVTTCHCERSFSAMRRLKNYSRSTMVSERLNGIALMHIHKDIILDTSMVIDRYSWKNRRLSFS